MPTVPDWARAWGEPPVKATIRQVAADFIVSEQLAVDFSGEGEHDWLWVEKTGANTPWVAGRLARHARVPERDVGFAGLKDRHAVTRQWFSVRRAAATDWAAFAADGVRILEVRRHRRKLKRGAHAGNRFAIVLRGSDIAASSAALDERLRQIGAEGVPNYFGEQRFGREQGNLELARALFDGRRLPRSQRSFALSAARSLLFNTTLDARVRAGNWNRLLPGEMANLDGSGSIFAVTTIDPELERRCAELDIHPTATLWGQGAPLSADEAAAVEQRAVAAWPDIRHGLEKEDLRAASRPLRLRVHELAGSQVEDGFKVEFALGAGAFATAVLREIADYTDAS